MNQKRTFSIRSLWHSLWTIFLNGFLTLLPITITVALLRLSIKFLMQWLAPVHTLIAHTFLSKIPYIEIILTALFVFLIGVIMKVFILRSLINVFESFIFKLPLIKNIYAGMKQLVRALSVQEKATTTSIVFVEFPRPGIYSIGFLTSTLSSEISPKKDTSFYNIFIPTTPNPTSGFFVMVPEKEVIFSSLSRQEAMAIIISGGIIQPQHLQGVVQHNKTH